ncbi:MAG: hypothetical protein L0H41_14635, partial [Microlunatus sp.]|nr:hypothetical protein [Microlunatus sp.]
YLSFDQEVAARLLERLSALAADPEHSARYDASTDRWSAEFDSGAGLIVYVLSDTHRRIVILRVLHLS